MHVKFFLASIKRYFLDGASVGNPCLEELHLERVFLVAIFLFALFDQDVEHLHWVSSYGCSKEHSVRDLNNNVLGRFIAKNGEYGLLGRLILPHENVVCHLEVPPRVTVLILPTVWSILKVDCCWGITLNIEDTVLDAKLVGCENGGGLRLAIILVVICIHLNRFGRDHKCLGF